MLVRRWVLGGYFLYLCFVTWLVFDFAFIYFSVRIEVLRAIATRISSQDITAYCVANLPKPYLSVGPPGGCGGGRTSFKYIEALETYGERLVEADLLKAYERAGGKFIGKHFIHYFGLLHVSLITVVVFPYR